jgi:DNA-binding MarR family transcriptional regulator
MKTTKTEFNFETPEASHGFLLWKLHAKWETGLKNLLKYHNLTHPQFVILATTTWFAQFASPPTQQDLANRTGIDPMTTSVIIRGLIKK